MWGLQLERRLLLLLLLLLTPLPHNPSPAGCPPAWPACTSQMRELSRGEEHLRRYIFKHM